MQQCVRVSASHSSNRSLGMPRTFLMVATLLTFSVLSSSPAPGPGGSRTPRGRCPQADAEPVNLKVLSKDISPEDLMKVMQGSPSNSACSAPSVIPGTQPPNAPTSPRMKSRKKHRAHHDADDHRDQREIPLPIHRSRCVAGAEDGKLWHLSSWTKHARGLRAQAARHGPQAIGRTEI